MAEQMSSQDSFNPEMTQAERAIVPALRERQEHIGRLGYQHAKQMLGSSDRLVEDRSSRGGPLLFIYADAIQDLGPEHKNQIEITVGVITDDAHIGSHVYLGPDAPPDIDARIYRRPLDTTVEYNMGEIIESRSSK